MLEVASEQAIAALTEAPQPADRSECAEQSAYVETPHLQGLDVIEQIRDWRTAGEGGGPAVVSFILCGKPVRVRFTEKHLLELQVIVNSTSEIAAD